MKYITIIIGLIALLCTSGCMMPDPEKTRAKNEAILFKEGFRVPFYQTYEDGTYQLNEKSAPMLEDGVQSPAFELESVANGSVAVGSSEDSVSYLLFFAPSVATPNTLQQLRKLSGWDAELQAAGIKTISILGDDLPQLSKSKEEYAISIPLLNDPDLVVSEQYGCAVDTSKMAQRTLVGIGKDGTVVFFSRGFAYAAPKAILEEFGIGTNGK